VYASLCPSNWVRSTEAFGIVSRKAVYILRFGASNRVVHWHLDLGAWKMYLLSTNEDDAPRLSVAFSGCGPSSAMTI
jgi:hypothetical protein